MKKKIKLNLKTQDQLFSNCRRNFKMDGLRKMETSEILSEKDKEKQTRSRRKNKHVSEECDD
jgi:hypothetical protein